MRRILKVLCEVEPHLDRYTAVVVFVVTINVGFKLSTIQDYAVSTLLECRLHLGSCSLRDIVPKH